MRKTIVRLAPVTGLLFATAALADGFVVLDYSASEDHAQTLRASGARIHVQAKEDWKPTVYAAALAALDADGNVITGFGQSGWLTSATSYPAADEILATNGSAYLLRAQNVESRDSAGAVLATSPTLYTGLATGSTGSKYAEVFARQPDGKFVIAGEYALSAMGGDSLRWTLTRVSADLSAVDTSLGGGTVVIDVPHGGSNQLASVRSIHVLADGKILMSGRSMMAWNPAEVWQTVIARLNSDGSLDGSFGSNALLVLPDSTGITQVDGSGRIYLAMTDGTVQRFSSSGTADAGYNGGAGDAALHVTGFELDSQGRAVLFGWTTVAAVRRGHVSRLDTSGAPDTTFNTTGIATVTFPFPLLGTRVADLDFPLCVGTLQATDKPLLACDVAPVGDADDSPLADLGLARLTTAGVVDTTFGTTQVDSDVFPDDFSFAPVIVDTGSLHVVSSPVTVSGVNAPVRIGANIEVSLGCNGTWQRSPAVVQGGSTFCVRADAPRTANTSTHVTVNVGGRVSTYVIQSNGVPADTIPDAFSFPSQTAVTPGALVTSAPITVRGVTGYTTISSMDGYYSINCDGQLRSVTYDRVENGMTICASHYASTTANTVDTTSVNIGGTIGTFATTTAAASSGGGGGGGSGSGGGSSGGSSSGGGGGSLDPLWLGFTLGVLGLVTRQRRQRPGRAC